MKQYILPIVPQLLDAPVTITTQATQANERIYSKCMGREYRKQKQ
jgi:hypothetical protein